MWLLGTHSKFSQDSKIKLLLILRQFISLSLHCQRLIEDFICLNNETIMLVLTPLHPEHRLLWQD